MCHRVREQAAACLQSGEEPGAFFPNCGCKDTPFFETETIIGILFSPLTIYSSHDTGCFPAHKPIVKSSYLHKRGCPSRTAPLKHNEIYVKKWSSLFVQTTSLPVSFSSSSMRAGSMVI
jgi:hypothetical protein